MTGRPDSSPSIFGLFLRAWWMFMGNAALLAVLALMAIERDEFPSRLDAVFAALVVSLAGARFADVRYFDGATTEGSRATMGHFRRYAVRLAAASATGWGVVSSMALL